MRYNNFVMDEKRGDNQKNSEMRTGKGGVKNAGKAYRAIVIGGGAAGLFFAAKYGDKNTLVLERGERTGRKLSATGGGWGNVTNESAAQFAGKQSYFTSELSEMPKIRRAVENFPPEALRGFFSSLGVLTFADERGRVYPLSRQASSLTDCLRREAARRGVEIRTGEYVCGVSVLPNASKNNLKNTVKNPSENPEKIGVRFEVKTQSGGVYFSENILICTGGKAAKNFGSDGNGYEIAKSIGHTIAPVSPALVQLKCAEKELRALKGIRIFDGTIGLYAGGKELARERGDILFTDFGVSGDGAFKISSYLPQTLSVKACEIKIDFLPGVSEKDVETAILKKLARYENLGADELAGGLLNNRAGAVIAGRAKKNLAENQDAGQTDKIALAAALAKEIKSFALTVTGTLGFDYAQVTKGGVKLSEVDENMQSLKNPGAYFAGEILNADGACGGYNLQWAFSSACAAGEAIFGGGANIAVDCKGKGR